MEDHKENHRYEENDKSAFAIAYGIMALSGGMVGLLLGWLIWG